MMRRGRERVRSNYKPSFSSTLLDSIYRSIDGEDFFDCDGGGGGGGDLILYRSDEGPLTRKKPSASERVRRKSTVTTTSSESSFGGFSSSDADSALNYGGGGTDSVRLKPIRTENRPSEVAATKKGVDGGGGSFRSRLRGASKIYSDLRKVRSPVRPGGRFAGFINSLFASAGNQRKHKPATPPARPISADATTPTTTSWSSASSCSRSCLSKSTASSKKANGAGGVKRTVRFYPVSVIVGEDCRPIGHKCIDEADGRRFSASLTAAPFSADAKRRVGVDDGSDELDLDRSSYSSSELFELENFAERYREELPVYETTHIGTNLAIAKGLIV
ncbi:hypothetical protein QJS10_CPB12g01749 [Acorus calamus]|uniref:Uncharacterized protein n=1 Tax=Acorus calamus TaxID=4465 RepID=A0AAV9DQM9_ACOCL|nr:hypothetical protein QJS10_CPB12g01749 [Acorus calamus]